MDGIIICNQESRGACRQHAAGPVGSTGERAPHQWQKRPRAGLSCGPSVFGRCFLPRGRHPCSVRIYRPTFRENKPKTLVFNDLKRSFWACFRENWVYKFGTGVPYPLDHQGDASIPGDGQLLEEVPSLASPASSSHSRTRIGSTTSKGNCN